MDLLPAGGDVMQVVAMRMGVQKFLTLNTMEFHGSP
jgi:hypothetical protein